MGERSSRKKAILVTLDELSEGSPKLFFEADFGCLDKVFFVSFFVSFFCLDPLFLFYHQFVFLNYQISYSIHDIKKKKKALFGVSSAAAGVRKAPGCIVRLTLGIVENEVCQPIKIAAVTEEIWSISSYGLAFPVFYYAECELERAIRRFAYPLGSFLMVRECLHFCARELGVFN